MINVAMTAYVYPDTFSPPEVKNWLKLSAIVLSSSLQTLPLADFQTMTIKLLQIDLINQFRKKGENCTSNMVPQLNQNKEN